MRLLSAFTLALVFVSEPTMPLAQTPNQIGARTMHHAAGPFDVKTTPSSLPAPAPQAARFSLDKHYHGALEATGIGEMLAGGDQKSGTAGYVALETVTGTLDGKTGSFQVMHWGTMSGGQFDLRLQIVPGSGTGALSGISGTMKIVIAPGGKHTYELDYTVPGSAAD